MDRHIQKAGGSRGKSSQVVGNLALEVEKLIFMRESLGTGLATGVPPVLLGDSLLLTLDSFGVASCAVCPVCYS